MSSEQNLYSVLLCRFTKGLGNIKGREVLEDETKLRMLYHSNEKLKRRVEEEIQNIRKKNIKTTTLLDPDYPEALRHIHNAPLLLYYYGTLPQGFCFSVVGTRKPSKYGLTTTQMIVSQLCEYHIPIVSGFAYGVDTVAHQTALKNETPTVAVLGTGIDVLYPVANTWMRKRIVESGGCLISEFPLGTTARPSNFPTRNRIISGLSNGILIVEAALGSGSLITAELGLEQGKNIFTIPGTLFGGSFKGNHNLVRLGAGLVENGYQILDEYPEFQKEIGEQKRRFKNPNYFQVQKEQSKITRKQNKDLPFSKEEKKLSSVDPDIFDGESIVKQEDIERILSTLKPEEMIIYQSIDSPVPLEVLMSKTQMSAPKILSLLTILILKGLIMEKGGLYYLSES